MADGETKKHIRKKKENVTITISPYLKKQLDLIVESGDFSSISDLATIALSGFVARYHAEKQNEVKDHKKIDRKPPNNYSDDYETEEILE